jgi:hypothetical protein
MRERGRMRGWLGIGLAAALLAPLAPTRPAVAGPFDYIKKADEERQKSQERDREQQERARQDQERQRQEQERRAQESQHREQQERQREQQERARQEQDRRAAEERQRHEARERQAEQQRQAQERAERQREQQERQREQQERARQQQETRERQRQHEEQTRAQQEQRARDAEAQRAREAQAHEERDRQTQQEQARRTRQEQEQRAQEAQTQEEQAQRAREEQARQAQQQRARQEQLRQQLQRLQQEQLRQPQNAARRVAAGPFDYIRKADEVRGRSAPQPAPRSAPVQREQPRPSFGDRGQSSRTGPFGTYRPQRGSSAPYRGGTQVTPPGSSVRESPFSSIRRPSSPAAVNPPTHTERPRPFGSAPAPGSVTTPPPPGSGPFGSVRTREPQTAVPPAPRGGRGSLDSYFGREPQRQRERDRRYGGRPYYPGGYYPGRPYDPYYDPYPPHYYDPSPYDYYPPVVIVPRPSPQVVIVPAPEVVVVPEQERLPDSDRAELESATLEQVLTDIEEAWVTGKLDLLMRHVRTDGKIQVYRDGEWTDALTREAFEEKTGRALQEYDTVSMTFAKPKLVGDTEASARAEHVYRIDGDREQRVFVTYSFRRFGKAWKVVGLDYERPKRVQTDPGPDGTAVAPKPPAEAPAATQRSSAPMPLFESMGTSAGPGQLHVVSAPPARVRDLLAAPRPRRLATLKQVRSGQRTLYTLEAMRGVAPGTLAWALYRQGEKRPRETGVADVSAMPAGAWIAVRTVAARLVTLAAGGRALPLADRGKKTLRLATRTFADPNVALVTVQAPASSTRRVAPVRPKARAAKK